MSGVFMMKESSFYTRLYEENSSDEKAVQCNLCGRMCKIANEGLKRSLCITFCLVHQHTP